LGRFTSAFRIAACHFTGKVLERAGVEQRLAELPVLEVAHLAKRRVRRRPFRRGGLSAALAIGGA
jgi:hypothetical protein